jgi:hypothetical protein
VDLAPAVGSIGEIASMVRQGSRRGASDHPGARRPLDFDHSIFNELWKQTKIVRPHSSEVLRGSATRRAARGGQAPMDERQGRFLISI